jgi:predicted nucleic acid-binding Zn ribbon protein
MPTYEFRAPDGTVHERFFRMSEVPASITLDDGTVAVRMISAGAGLVFKGEGFYITDYGKDGKKDQRAAAKPSASPKADSAKPDAPKADAPKADAPKAEAKPAPAAPKTD